VNIPQNVGPNEKLHQINTSGFFLWQIFRRRNWEIFGNWEIMGIFSFSGAILINFAKFFG
jgi:hypothetical protein